MAASVIALGIPRPTRQKAAVKLFARHFRSLPLAFALLIAVLSGAVYAQLEGGERGVAPLDSSSSFQVNGVMVDVSGPSAELARTAGWRLAQRRGWEKLWAQTHATPAPNLGDHMLNDIVSGIVVEDEQIGPNRYVARLGVLFDRVRSGDLLGVSGQKRRSVPLLVIPVQYAGGMAQSFETRTEWQKAWARFRASDSAIDYVRPTGSGVDPLLLTAAQVQRPGRRWWRMLLDQYGAADVIVPQVRLERLYPGGPVIGHFSVFLGPDAKPVGRFTLATASGQAIPRLMDAGAERIDLLLTQWLRAGRLRPDSSLIIERPVDAATLSEVTNAQGDDPAVSVGGASANSPPLRSFTVQFESPDVGSISATEALVRGAAGVRSASTTSLALGGVSVMRVSFEGDADALRAALSGRGLHVSQTGDTLRIRR